MKQFDTVKNNEFIPTEEDIEYVVLVTDALPTASKDLEGKTYLLNGVMENYVKSHFYKCVKDTDTNTYVWSDLNVGRYSVGGCTNIRLIMFDDGSSCRVLMCWKDPDDVLMPSDRVYWQETRLVHQVGHMPTSVSDGTVLVTNTVRNQYQTLGSFSTTIDNTSGRKHYFKLFPISTDGGVTNDDSNGRVAGFNYIATMDSKPYQIVSGDGKTEAYVYAYTKTYYIKVYNSSTGVYTYEKCDTTAGSSYFDWSAGTDLDPSHATFKKGTVYYEYTNSFITWAGIQELVKNGEAETFFPLGTILTLPYHGDFGDMGYEIVDYDTVQPADGSINHTMTLQSKYLYTWWDYTQGVVFDTNEKGAVQTPDTTRDYSKVYFRRVGGNRNSFGNAATDGTKYQRYNDASKGNYSLNVGNTYNPAYVVGAAVATYSDNQFQMYVYPESTYDGVGMGDSKACVEYISRGDSKVDPSIGMTYLYECELPYKVGRVTGGVYVPFRPNLALAGTPAMAPSAMPLKINNGKTGADSVEVSGIVNYRANIEYGENLSEHMGYGKGDYRVVSSNTTNTVAAVVCMGPLESDVTGVNSFDPCRRPAAYIPPMLPRYNYYADRFMRLPLVSGSSYGKRRWFDTATKYYCPIEQYVGVHMDYDRTDSKTTNDLPSYRSRHRVWMRDCTDDIISMCHKILNNYSTNKDYVLGPSSSFSVDLTAALSGYSTGTDPANPAGTPVMPQLCIPTQDGTYLPGKRYFKLAYTLTGDGTFDSGKLYYRKISVDGKGSALVTYDGTKDDDGNLKAVNYDVYQRVRPNSLYGTVPKDKGLYESSYVELVPGTDYKIGDLIPCKTSTPTFFHSRLDAEACVGETPVEGYIYYDSTGKVLNQPTSANVATKRRCFWTNGQVDADGEYVEITTDSAGTTLPTDFSVDSKTKVDYSTTGCWWVDENSAATYSPWRITEVYEPMISYSATGFFQKTGSTAWTYAGDDDSYATNKVTLARYIATTEYVAGANYYYYGTVDRVTGYFSLTVSSESDFATKLAKYTEGEGKYGLFTDGVLPDSTDVPTIANGGIVENCNIFWKMPNMERVQYGNHVWAQSNLRMYFNGPFDSSTEYMPTKDTKFGFARNSVPGITSDANYTYYKKVGADYVKLIAGTDYTIGNSIAEWEGKTGFTVYQRYYGGTPIGAKLEVNRPDMYDRFGRSPVQQYKYNTVTGNWEAVFDDSELWWGNGMTSINNGLNYDRLAPMFCANYIDKGESSVEEPIIGAPYLSITHSRGDNKISYGGTVDNCGAVRTNESTFDKNYDFYPGIHWYDTSTGTKVTKNLKYYSNMLMPRQSFLHGFLDCKYKRTSDTTFAEGKTYYWRNPYGEYVVADSATMKGARSESPYKLSLYEYNEDYLTDIQSVGEFLDAIIPVVNRNGAHGTEGAFDFYSQEAGKLNGTMCIDKVWLMSAAQIAGGDSANNGVYENPKTNTYMDEMTTKSSLYPNKKLALKKWRWCANHPEDFGYTSGSNVYANLNLSRVKNYYTISGHSSIGFADTNGGDAYWWLRSAGVHAYTGWQGHPICGRPHGRCIAGGDRYYGLNGKLNSVGAVDMCDPYTVKRLSPLISIG